MLNHIETIFDDMAIMMKKLKKPIYKENMETFCEKNGHHFSEMVDYIDQKEDKVAAATEIAVEFTNAVENKFSKNGKMKGRTQADLNFFMIYYVFPSILMTNHLHAELLAQSICNEWGRKFKDSNIGFANYDKIYESFKNKIFGIF